MPRGERRRKHRDQEDDAESENDHKKDAKGTRKFKPRIPRRRSSSSESDSTLNQDSSDDDTTAAANGEAAMTYAKLIEVLKVSKKHKEDPKGIEPYLEETKIAAVVSEIEEDVEKLTNLGSALINTGTREMLHGLALVVSELEGKGKQGSAGNRKILDQMCTKPKYLASQGTLDIKAQKEFYLRLVSLYSDMTNVEKPAVNTIGWQKFSQEPHPYFMAMAKTWTWCVELDDAEKMEVLQYKLKSLEELAKMELEAPKASLEFQYVASVNQYQFFDHIDTNICYDTLEQMFLILLDSVEISREFTDRKLAVEGTPKEKDSDYDDDDECKRPATACEAWLAKFLSCIDNSAIDKMATEQIDRLLNLFFEGKHAGRCTVEDSEKKIIDVVCECDQLFIYDTQIEETVFRVIQKSPQMITAHADLLGSIIERFLNHPTFSAYSALVRLYPSAPEHFSKIFERLFDYVDNDDYESYAFDLLRQAAIVDKDVLQRHHVLILERFMDKADGPDELQQHLVILLTVVENRKDLITGLGDNYLDMAVNKGLNEACLSLVAEILGLRATNSEREARSALEVLFTDHRRPRFQSRDYQNSILQGLQMVANLFPKIARQYQPYISASVNNPFLRKEALELQAILDGRSGKQKSSGSCTLL